MREGAVAGVVKVGGESGARVATKVETVFWVEAEAVVGFVVRARRRRRRGGCRLSQVCVGCLRVG